MGIRIVPITKDSDAKRRKRTTSKIKGTPSENESGAEEKYMKRNDGGKAMSGRGKPVRTF